MNHARILRILNGLLLFIGYQLHCLNLKSHRYRLSLWMICYFIVLSLLYLISFAHHFEKSAILKLLQDVSPFMKHLVRVQLIMGLKIFLFGIYELRKVTQAANELFNVLPKVYAKKFCRKEAYAHFLNFSTLFIGFCITFYIIYEMDFELPPLDNILVFSALFAPHFIIGGSMKLYNISMWLLREEILGHKEDFERLLPEKLEKSNDAALVSVQCGSEKVQTITCSDNWVPNPENEDFTASLLQLNRQLTQLAKTEKLLNTALERQLFLLMLLNCNCLLAGTYSRVYYETTWHLIFQQRTKNVFQATNCGIFILIIWDYLTFCMTQAMYEKVKIGFAKSVYAIIKQRRFTEATRFALSDLHDLLKNEFNFKLLGGMRFSVCSFIIVQIFIALIIALIVVYHYLNDQILALSERFDVADSNED